MARDPATDVTEAATWITKHEWHRPHLAIRAAEQLIQLVQNHNNLAGCAAATTRGDEAPQLSQRIRRALDRGHGSWPDDRIPNCRSVIAGLRSDCRAATRRREQAARQVLIHSPRVPQVHAVDGHEQRRRRARLHRESGALPDDLVHRERLACSNVAASHAGHSTYNVVANAGTFTITCACELADAGSRFHGCCCSIKKSAEKQAVPVRTCARQAGDVDGPAAGSRQVLPQRRLQGVDLRLAARWQLPRRHAGAHVQHQLDLPHLPHEQLEYSHSRVLR